MKRSEAATSSLTSKRSIGSLLVFLLVAIGWTSIPFLRPSPLSNESFLFHDNSYTLFAVDQLLAGKVLFRDLFYQYGVFTAYLYTGWAALFGNTILSSWRLAQLLTCVGVIQLWVLLRRSQSPARALAFGVFVLLPYFLIPGGSLESAGSYAGLERVCLLLVALAWTSPFSRSRGAALRIGLLLGVMQWIKFGGAFVAGASVVIVDLLVLISLSRDRKRWLDWLRISLVTLAGFLVMEGVLAALLFLMLPAQLAGEVLWPFWMRQSYQAYAYKSVSLLHWFNFNYFLGVQLPLVAAVLLGLIFAYRFLRRRGGVTDDQSAFIHAAGPALFLVIFFALALRIYLPHMWVAMTYAWMILLPAAFFLRQIPRWWLVIFLVLCTPAFLLSAKGVVHRRTAGLREVQLAGDTLWLSAESTERMSRLQRVLAQLAEERGETSTERPPILGFPMGSGFHHFLGYPPATRHAWFISGFVRPREEQTLVASLDRTLAVVVFFSGAQKAQPSADPATWEFFSIPLLSEQARRAIADRLANPIEVDAGCWVFPVRNKGSR